MPGEPTTPVTVTVPHRTQWPHDAVADTATLTSTRRALSHWWFGTHGVKVAVIASRTTQVQGRARVPASACQTGPIPFDTRRQPSTRSVSGSATSPTDRFCPSHATCAERALRRVIARRILHQQSAPRPHTDLPASPTPPIKARRSSYGNRVILRIALIGVTIIVFSWLMMIVLAKRLPPGSAKDLASVLPACVTTIRRLRKDPRVPRSAKIAIAFAGLWVLSPIDLIPEFLPVIGPLDDIVVVALAFRFAARRVPHAAIYEAWPADPALLERLLRPRRQRSGQNTT